MGTRKACSTLNGACEEVGEEVPHTFGYRRVLDTCDSHRVGSAAVQHHSEPITVAVRYLNLNRVSCTPRRSPSLREGRESVSAHPHDAATPFSLTTCAYYTRKGGASTGVPAGQRRAGRNFDPVGALQ